MALAKTKLEALEKFTKTKMLTQLRSDIEAARVQLDGEKASHAEELSKLKDIEEQIAKCKVVAPMPGQVVYANVQSSRSSNEFVCEQGAAVRERQVIIRLPDPTKMQIKAKINENRINLVEVGMKVDIRIDAFGDVELGGEVTKVNKYAEPGNWWNSSSKEYVCLIQIENPPPEIRSGLTAEVQIHVQNRQGVLQVPVQAIYERSGETFCLVKHGGAYKTKRIVFASTNDKTVAIDEAASDSFEVGEQVVMDPRAHSGKFDFTGFPELKKAKKSRNDKSRNDKAPFSKGRQVSKADNSEKKTAALAKAADDKASGTKSQATSGDGE